MKRKATYMIIIFFPGFLIIGAAPGKLIEASGFGAFWGDVPFMGIGAGVVGNLLPLAELLTALLLIFLVWALIGLCGLPGLLVVFEVYWCIWFCLSRICRVVVVGLLA